MSSTRLLDAYNETHDPDITGDAGWVPTLRGVPVTATTDVPAHVTANAGAGKLGI